MDIDTFQLSLDGFGLLVKTNHVIIKQALKKPAIEMNNVHLNINLLKSIFSLKPHYSSIYIDNLTLNFSYNKRWDLFGNGSFDVKEFFALFNINDMHIKVLKISTDKDYFLSHIYLKKQDSKLHFEIKKQKIPFLKIPKIAVEGDVYLDKNIKFKDVLFRNDDVLMALDFDFESISIDLKSFNLAKIKYYLLKKYMNEGLYLWLKKSFISGEIINGSIFVDIQKNNPIVVDAHIPIKNTKIKFDKDWQEISNIDGVVKFINNKVKIIADAKMNNIAVKNIKAIVENSIVDVNVNGIVKTENINDFLDANVYLKPIAKDLKKFKFKGSSSFKVDLSIPLSESPTITDIKIDIKDNELEIIDLGITALINSKIEYKNNNLYAKGHTKIFNKVFQTTLSESQGNPLIVKLVEDKIKIELSNNNHQWKLRLAHPVIKASLYLDSFKIKVRELNLDNLDKVVSKNTNIDFYDIFPAEVYINQIIYKNKTIAKAKFKIEKPNTKTIEVKGNFFNSNIDIKVDAKLNNKHTFLNTKLTSLDFGKFIKSILPNSSAIKGKLKANAKLLCDCSILKVDLKKIQGDISFGLKKGSFLDDNFFLGKILSVLNFKTLAKRLNLNLSDVTNKGFIYDEVNASFNLKDGLLHNKSFEVLSSSSYISIEGYNDLLNKQNHYTAKILPSVSTSIPIVAYLSGAGLLGLGVWAIDELLNDGKTLDNVAAFDYKITGSWDKPIIK
ncbi:FIG005080: Possible exported protein [hydrothermal vent metagenome]|uniref:FIG005080: Possible exported protein n=1 Tax=hydrothermal vent metagenome TaxID=652676 RepID=A0A1W1BQA1_9ZZZZ